MITQLAASHREVRSSQGRVPVPLFRCYDLGGRRKKEGPPCRQARPGDRSPKRSHPCPCSSARSTSSRRISSTPSASAWSTGCPSQEILARVGEELLSTTKLPLAVSFLHTEIKGSGLMAPAMARIGHYFTAFQTHVIGQAEIAMSRFSMEQALLILEREAKYKADGPSLAGLFIFQFESLSRNRLGYTRGLAAMAQDPFYTEDWSDYILTLQTRLGDVDFADLIFVRSDYFVQRATEAQPRVRAQVSRPLRRAGGEDRPGQPRPRPDVPLLGTPAPAWLSRSPAPRRPDELEARVLLLEQKIAQLENRLKVAESELNQDVDLSQVMVKPEDTAGVPSGWGKKARDSGQLAVGSDSGQWAVRVSYGGSGAMSS